MAEIILRTNDYMQEWPTIVANEDDVYIQIPLYCGAACDETGKITVDNESMEFDFRDAIRVLQKKYPNLEWLKQPD